MKSTKKYIVSILNEPYSLVSDESGRDIYQAASYIDQMIKEFVAKGIDKRKAAVIAAMKIYIDFMHCCQNNTLIQEKIARAISQIDETLC